MLWTISLPSPKERAFCSKSSRAIRRPTFLPAVPAGALRLVLGEFAGVLLASQRVLPRRAQSVGYTFAHPRLEGALRDLK